MYALTFETATSRLWFESDCCIAGPGTFGIRLTGRSIETWQLAGTLLGLGLSGLALSRRRKAA
jgi:hypothetical protein